jgi:hypothetical protein
VYKIALENLSDSDYQHTGVVTTLDQRSGNFIAKVVYDDGFGRDVTLKKSISSIKEDAS